MYFSFSFQMNSRVYQIEQHLEEKEMNETLRQEMENELKKMKEEQRVIKDEQDRVIEELRRKVADLEHQNCNNLSVDETGTEVEGILSIEESNCMGQTRAPSIEPLLVDSFVVN